jgi:hypothetical protein
MNSWVIYLRRIVTKCFKNQLYPSKHLHAQGFLGYGLCTVVCSMPWISSCALRCGARWPILRWSAMHLFLYNNIQYMTKCLLADTYAVLHLMEKGRRFLTRKSELVKRSCDPIFRWSENLCFLRFIFHSFRINVEQNGKWSWKGSVKWTLKYQRFLAEFILQLQGLSPFWQMENNIFELLVD